MSRQDIQYTSYGIRILHFHHIFDDTLRIYTEAVKYLMSVIQNEWNVLSDLANYEVIRIMEKLVHSTKQNPSPKYDFDRMFYKMPSYIRRAAIEYAFGKISSYKSNLENWNKEKTDLRGKKTRFPKLNVCYPTLYNKNAFMWSGQYTAKLKVYIRNTWDFIEVDLRKSDVNYFNRHNEISDSECPTLIRNGKRWTIRFPFKHKTKLNNIKHENELVLGVDLGVNNACVCTAMMADGTIRDRRFLSLPRETDRLDHHIGLIKKAQQHGSRNPVKYWTFANNINLDITRKTVSYIVNTAVELGCTHIVMEHLDIHGKKHSFKKQRLHLWKVREVQKLVTAKAHIHGIRVATVYAGNTSKLAFDGSGEVVRDKENFSLCTFKTGKRYNTDLNASYNIAARYFIRAICKSVPETVRLSISAKVPNCDRRSTCTLSDLLKLHTVVYGVDPVGA